jgi:GT2 family glycosyltransferase
MTNTESPSTWVLIPVHNRCEITTQCLSHLKETQEWKNFNILVIDDGSTDGTQKAIRKKFPAVTILQADGTLWWGGSIRYGMEYAKNEDADVFIWLNDDVLPEPGGVAKLADKTYELGDTVLTTRVEVDSEFRDQSYLSDLSIGGIQLLSSSYSTCQTKTRLGMRLSPYDTTDQIQSCDATAGKFTAFPVEIVENIGYPNDELFPHNYCDHDYTLRAKEQGFNVGVYTDVSARDTGHELKESRLSSEISLKDLLKNSFHPGINEAYNIKTRYRRYMRFYGSPKLISYLVFTLYLVVSFAIVCMKVLLVIAKDEQKLID